MRRSSCQGDTRSRDNHRALLAADQRMRPGSLTSDHPYTKHRGRKRDPLFKICKILLAGSERVTQGGVDRMLLGLRSGDPNDELLGARLPRNLSGTCS